MPIKIRVRISSVATKCFTLFSGLNLSVALVLDLWVMGVSDGWFQARDDYGPKDYEKLRK